MTMTEIMNRKRFSGSMFVLLLSVLTVVAQNNTLSIPDVTVEQGKSISLPVNMDNTADVVAVQFTISVPDGITLEASSAALSDRSDGHTLSMRQIAVGKYMAMMFSDENKAVIGRTGRLMNVSLKADISIEEGTVLPLQLSDVVISAIDGSNLATGYSAGSVSIAKSPDFEVSGVSAATDVVSPGDKLSVNWQVTNVGGLPAKAGWKERVFLEAGDGTSKLLGTLYWNEGLVAGGVVSRSAEIEIPSVLGLDGTAKVSVLLTADSDSGEPVWLQSNNTAMSESDVTVNKLLELTPSVADIDEATAKTVRFRLTRSGSVSVSQDFNVEASADSRISFPESVTIPQGQSGVYFYAQVTPDKLLNDNSLVNVSVGGNAYSPVSSVLNIEDDTYPDLYIESDVRDITEGGSIRFIIISQRAVTSDLEVSLSCDNASRFVIPSSIVIPAGESAVEVVVASKDDDVPDVDEAVTFKVVAQSHNPASTFVILVDNDIPALQMELTPDAVAEDAGPMAVIMKLRRTDNIDKLVTIKLSDDSENAIYYSRNTFEMTPGVEEVTINLGPVDNSTVEGERTYNISASVFIASCNCNASKGSAGGVVTKQLTVYDNDGPALSLTASASVLKEGAEMPVTIARNTQTSQTVTVFLTCDNESVLEFPSTVTIPAGSASATFTVKSVANDVTGDGINVLLTASADGFSKANTWFTISDQTLPDAQITDIFLSKNVADVEGTVIVDISIENVGSYALSDATEIVVYADNRPLDRIYLQTTLEPGCTTVVSDEIKMPSKIGTYKLYAVVNPDKKTKELTYNNNTSKVLEVKVEPSYSAVVTIGRNVYDQGETIILSGRIDGNDVEAKPVEIYVINGNYRHVINSTTDADGSFEVSYLPYGSQIGHFIAGACYPGEEMRDAQVEFDVLGMRKEYGYLSFYPLLGQNYSGTFKITNPNGVPLTGVTATIVSQSEQDCTINALVASEIAPGATVSVTFDLLSNVVNTKGEWEIASVLISTSEGLTTTMPLYYCTRNPKAQLSVDTKSLFTTMTKGVSREIQIHLSNIGQGDTGPVEICLPEWMKLVSPEITNLKTDEESVLVLSLIPTDQMQLNVPLLGKIAVNCSNGDGIVIPYNITPVSDINGTLIIDVCDENTYYAAGEPHVSGADVTVREISDGIIVVQGKTDNNGMFTTELPEGYYMLSVTDGYHESYNNTILINPGVDNLQSVFIGLNGVSFNYELKKTEIEDVYEIVTNVTFETNVPLPAVVISGPKSVDGDSMLEGEQTVLYYTLTNKGLLTAQNVTFRVPESNGTWAFTALAYTEPFALAPQQSVLIPVLLEKCRKPKLAYSASNLKSSATNVEAESIARVVNNCMAVMSLNYEAICGDKLRNNETVEVLSMGICMLGSITSGLMDLFTNLGLSNLGGMGSGNKPASGPHELENKKKTQEEKQTGVKSENYLTFCDPEDAKCAAAIVNNLLSLGGGPAKFAIEKTFEACKEIRDINNKREEEIKNGLPPTDITDEWLMDKVKETMKDCNDVLESAAEELNNAGDDGISVSGVAGNVIEHGKKVLDIAIACEHSYNKLHPRNAQGKGDALQTFYDYYHQIEDFKEFCEELYGKLEFDKLLNDDVNPYIDYIVESIADNTPIEEIVENRPKSLLADEALYLIDRIRNTVLRYNEPNLPVLKSVSFGAGLTSEVSASESDDNYIDFEALAALAEEMENLDYDARVAGFNSKYDQFRHDYTAYQEFYGESSSNVCASVTLQFSQSMVMTRQAFRGTLTVFNGHETNAMENIRLNLTVSDIDGNLATKQQFEIKAESLDNLSGNVDLADGWTLMANSKGSATVLYVPSRYAAPTENKIYYFAGTLSYLDPFTGVEVTRELSPVPLTVMPSPYLSLTYFMQRDIYGDDPLTTDVIEPSIEAEFSVLIDNKGYGDANNVQIVTKQPEIIINEKGLDNEFRIVSGQLNGGEKIISLGESIPSDFGTISAHGTAYAQWWFKSNLLGWFTEYDVKANHVSKYSSDDFSLIDMNDVTIHSLMRSLDIDSNSEKKLAGFMTEDFAENTPDRIYMTNGEVEDVYITTSIFVNKASDTEYYISVTPSALGWNYGCVKDPTYGMSELKSVVRQSDGKEISLRNFWQTDRTLSEGRDPIYENKIHFADNFLSTDAETYILTFDPLPELILNVASIDGVPNGDFLKEPLSEVSVIFNKQIDASTFNAEDITLTIQGQRQDASLISISTEDNKTFCLDFSKLNETAGNGYYVLSVQTAGVVDNEGYCGKTGKSVSWIMFKDGFVTLNTSAYPENAGSVSRQAPVMALPVMTVQMDVDENKAEYGSNVTFTNSPNDGFEFVSWSVNGQVVSEESVLVYPALDDLDVVANYSKKMYLVSVSANADEGGSITGGTSGIYNYGDKLTLMAIPSEDFMFDSWIVNGEIVSASATLSQVIDRETEITAVFIRDVYEQRIVLDKGWNWVSSYLAEPIGIAEFSDYNTNRILGQDNELVHDANLGLVGNMESINAGAAYKLEATYANVKVFKGHLHNTEDLPVSLITGWNWISYPYYEERSLNDVIANATEGDFITTQDGFAEFADGYWEGTLRNLIPGRGYLYKSLDNKSLSFDFDGSKVVLSNNVGRLLMTSNTTNNRQVDIHRYPSNMNIIARLESSSEVSQNQKYRIYAFAGNECRGIGQLVGDNYYITVYGEEPVNISFVVEDLSNGSTYLSNESLIFNDDVVGSRKSPFVLTFGNTTDMLPLYGDSHKMRVYSIEGVLISSDATIETLQKLRSGIYIVDGHKYIVQ